MGMSFWTVLNIQPTNDILAIKKAYALRLRQCHPEDDPQGYQKLREAYETAIKHAKRSSANNRDNNSSNNINRNNTSSRIETEETNFNRFNGANQNHNDCDSNNEIKDLEQRFNDILAEAEKIYNDLSSRIDLDCWRVLFNRDLFWDLVNKEKLIYMMINFIASHHYYPKEIWEFFDINLNIQQNSKKLKYTFPKKFVYYMLRRIKEPDGLEYKHLIDLNLSDLEEFLKYRERAFDEIKDREYEDAYKSLVKALEIYEYDPDLIRLHSEYYVLNYDSDLALIYLNNLLEKNPNDFASLFKRAKFLFDRKEYNSVIEDLKKALEIKQDIEVVTFLAQCYIVMENYTEAKKVILKAMETNVEDSKLKESLLLINKKIRGKLEYDLIDRPRDKDLKTQIKQIDAEIYAHYQHDYKKMENYDPPELNFIRRFFSKKNIITYIILLLVLIASIGLFKGSFYSNSFEVFNFIRYLIGVSSLMIVIILIRR